MNFLNPMLNLDGYKTDHRRQYPDGTTRVLSNWTPRGSRIAGVDRVVFFGLQYFLKEYLGRRMRDHFFSRPRAEVLAEYAGFLNGYLGPNDVGVEHIDELHDLGYVPLEFRALPEGSLCPLRVPALTVENTHDGFAWLVNYFETILSAVLWLPCTSATQAWRLRAMLNRYAAETGGAADFVQWQGHDFSFRGMGGLEAAMLSGAGHLLSFTGTDTVPAIAFVHEYYTSPRGALIGGSVPATEHSVMCAGGEECEADTFGRLLKLYPNGIVSVVSDTWDLWFVLTHVLPGLRAQIMARDGKLVIRPDSGDPVKIVCGDPEAAAGSPQNVGVVRLLWEVFGGTTTATGHRQLDSHIGVIYGDAISFDRAEAICRGLQANGYASTNVVFGVGSFTYQHVTRDTFGFAMKATWARIGGVGKALFKKPVTDGGEKFSAVGRLAVADDGGRLTLIHNATKEQEEASALLPAWRDGAFLRRTTFEMARAQLRHAGEESTP